MLAELARQSQRCRKDHRVLTSRIVKDVHDQQLRELETRLRLCESQADCTGGIRQIVGRALIHLGSGMAAECPPQLARR